MCKTGTTALVVKSRTAKETLSMCHIAKLGTIALGSILALTAMVCADVVIRGPFGRQIVIPSPDNVLVGPRNVMVNPTPGPNTAPPGLLPGETIEPPLAVPVGAPTSAVPVVAPPPPPPPPMSAAEFVRTFKPTPGTHQVTLLHTRTNQPVAVTFELPAGEPRVHSYPHAIVFDYGRTEVEIRFQVGGKVSVMTTR